MSIPICEKLYIVIFRLHLRSYVAHIVCGAMLGAGNPGAFLLFTQFKSKISFQPVSKSLDRPVFLSFQTSLSYWLSIYYYLIICPILTCFFGAFGCYDPVSFSYRFLVRLTGIFSNLIIRYGTQ